MAELGVGLQTAQQHAASSLASLAARLEQLRSFSRDYGVLLTRLQTLPHKTRHEVMVPLGPLAFQPGFLHHTNEVTVLLGENFFVERSASQAAEIIKRRQAYLSKQIAAVQTQIDNTSSVDQAGKQLFGGGAATMKPKAPQGADEDAEEQGLDASLGVSFGKDGVMRNEEGEEIIEIKEDYVDEDEELAAPAAAASSSSSSAPAAVSSSSAIAGSAVASSSASMDFPSMLDKNFDQFWDELEDLEQQAEAAEKTAAPAPAPVPTPTEQKSAVDDLLPVPSPPLRPISSPADIFRHITQAKLKAGEPVPAAASPTPPPAAAAAVMSQSSSLDASFGEYKAARRARKQARVSARVGQPKRVAFAADDDQGDSSSEEEMDKGRPLVQTPPTVVAPPKSLLKKKPSPAVAPAASAASAPKPAATRPSPAAALAPTPLARSAAATAAERAAFTGEIHERGPAGAPVARALPPTTASARASAAAPPAAAAQPKMSKFKLRQLGLSEDD